MSELISAMVLVFVAELGDKTQLVAFGLGARYRLRLVVVGIAIAYLAAGHGRPVRSSTPHGGRGWCGSRTPSTAGTDRSHG